MVIFGHVAPSETNIERWEFIVERIAIVAGIVDDESPNSIFGTNDGAARPTVAAEISSPSGLTLSRRTNAFHGAVFAIEIDADERPSEDPDDNEYYCDGTDGDNDSVATAHFVHKHIIAKSALLGRVGYH